MKKKFDFDKELKKLEEELDEGQKERARILVTVIPFVLMILILGIFLIFGNINNQKKDDKNQELQESIKDYADTTLAEITEDEDEISKEESVAEESEKTTPIPQVVQTPDNPQATEKPYEEIMKPLEKDYSKIEYNAEAQLSEMMSYWKDNHQKALKDLVNLDRYKAMSYSLSGTKEFYYYGEKDANGKPHGKGIAVYADNQYYYGDWQNGLRSGIGTWMHYHIHETPSKTDLYLYHQYAGNWKNDLPDGEGSEHYDYNPDNMKGRNRYNNNLIGTYAKGLVHGEFYLTNINREGEVFEWYATGENGSWVYRSENRDSMGRGPVQVENKDPDNYIWLHPDENKNIGVSCLISSQKN